VSNLNFAVRLKFTFFFVVTVTQAQYEIVKDVILDLLGWGVPPAYLMDCGVSREAIFYVFSELNLALPEHFDVSGFVPYLPEAVMPPPPLPGGWTKAIDTQSHPSSAVRSPLAKASFLPNSPSVDLHDIERQRRQELLARKAAQASRRTRHSTSIDSSTGTISVAQEHSGVTPASATEAVDDFLNSIGSIPEVGVRTRSVSPSSERRDASDKMDVQETTEPSTADLQLRDSFGNLSTLVEGNSSIIEQTPPISAETPITSNNAHVLASVEAPPTSGSSSTFSQASDTEERARSHLRSIPHAPSLPSRRSMKRAVATDFDFDAVPRRNGFSQPPPAKQPRTTFGNIGSRRCVIELSDSEGEDGSSRHVLSAPFLEQTSSRRSKSTAYPSLSVGKPSTPNVSVSPSALLQKELEIQRMRDLIARCEEETRMKKLAVSLRHNIRF